MSVQLDVVEPVEAADADDLLWELIDKNAYALGITRQVVRLFADITARLGPEDHTEPVDAQRLDVLDIGALTHATYLDH